MTLREEIEALDKLTFFEFMDVYTAQVLECHAMICSVWDKLHGKKRVPDALLCRLRMQSLRLEKYGRKFREKSLNLNKK